MARMSYGRFIIYFVSWNLNLQVGWGSDITPNIPFPQTLDENLKRAVEDAAGNITDELFHKLSEKIDALGDKTIEDIVLVKIRNKYTETSDKIKQLGSNLTRTLNHKLNVTESAILSKVDDEISKITSDIRDKYLDFEKQINTDIDSKQKTTEEHLSNATESMLRNLDTQLDQLMFNVSSKSNEGSSRTMVVFSALLTKNVLSDGTNYIAFDHVVTNIGHGYNKTGGFFTTPIDGVFTFTSVFLVDDGYVNIKLTKNGNEIARGYAAKDVREGAGFVSVILNLKTGDEVGIKMIPGWITGCMRGDFYSSFSGTKVGH
ncbi:Hypothetical predicted protein [Mytilus galloprovincialis]|uniref:C1q domain-containing protein n=1 Tax=Mytilus galloprovincialis TaxID=29158 RepID=A0A8B6HHS6_MYTGA|nr:Hypothetical predicted protein [Mytilus galloprovincialis]